MLAQSHSKVNRIGQASDADLIPLVIDLDNGLLQTNLAWERALSFVRVAPWRLFLLCAWFFKGRAAGMARLSRAARLDAATLPVNETLIAFAVAEHRHGRPVHLATAANEVFARQIARRFSFIDRVFASDGDEHGAEKAFRLASAFPSGFMYASDGRSDLPVWRVAAAIVVTGASSRILREARRIREPIAILDGPDRWHAARKLLRPHQWSKNALVFVPALGIGALVASVLVFVLSAK